MTERPREPCRTWLCSRAPIVSLSHEPDVLHDAMRIVGEAKIANIDRLVWLYAIQAGDDGPVKLGIAKKPAERIVTLQQGNAVTLRGLAAWRGLPLEEKLWHQEFDQARIRGEWFKPVPELVDLVLRLGGDFEDWER